MAPKHNQVDQKWRQHPNWPKNNQTQNSTVFYTYMCKHLKGKNMLAKLRGDWAIKKEKKCFKLCLSLMSFLCTIQLKRHCIKTKFLNAVICEINDIIGQNNVKLCNISVIHN